MFEIESNGDDPGGALVLNPAVLRPLCPNL